MLATAPPTPPLALLPSQPLVPSLPVFVGHAKQPSKELIKPKAILGRPVERPMEAAAVAAADAAGDGAAGVADECPGPGAPGELESKTIAVSGSEPTEKQAHGMP